MSQHSGRPPPSGTVGDVTEATQKFNTTRECWNEEIREQAAPLGCAFHEFPRRQQVVDPPAAERLQRMVQAAKTFEIFEHGLTARRRVPVVERDGVVDVAADSRPAASGEPASQITDRTARTKAVGGW